MKKILLSMTLAASAALSAQSDLIAVSGSDAQKISFQDFRYLDLNDNLKSGAIAESSAEIPEQIVGMTYDKQNQNLVFVGMMSPDFYTYNLKSKQYTQIYKSGQAFSRCSVGEQFSRMTTAADGTIYALNNSSTALYAIKNTNGNYHVDLLGSLNLIESKESLTQTKFYGGDMIADDAGNLYLISAYSNVLKINPAKLEAEFIGKVKGIEMPFTTNGSAVMANGRILLSNAQGKGMYEMDFAGLQAKKLNDTSAPIYDLASPYLLPSKISQNQQIAIYPTKLTEDKIFVSLQKELSGKGLVSIYDIGGNELIRKNINLSEISEKRINTISLRPGNYIIKVKDENGKELLKENFMVVK